MNNYINLDIPYEVVVFLVKNEIWEKNLSSEESDSRFKTIILAKEKATKPKIEKVISFLIEANSTDSYKLKPEDIKTTILRNDGFYLSLIPEPDRRYCLNSYCTEIGFSNSKLKAKYELSTFITESSINSIVCSCSYITNYQIHGKYFYKNEQNFYQYRPEDSNLIDNLSRVEILGENKKTSGFQVGHKYLLKNKTQIIYLGIINKDVRYRNDYTWRNENDHSYFPDTLRGYITKYNNRAHFLYLNLDNIYRDGYIHPELSSVEEFVDMYKGSGICNFLIDWIKYYESNSPDRNLKYCLSFSDTLPSGVDLGEYFKDDNNDIRDTLDHMCFEKLKDEFSKPSKTVVANDIIPYVYSMTSDYLTKFDDTTKEKLFNILIKPSLVEMFRKNTYRFRSDVIDKMKAENTSAVNLYNIAKSVGSYYVEELGSLVGSKDSIANLIFKGSDDKLNTLIIECKKACIK